ncbi:MAG: rod shape-determining protein MreC [Chloroflexi bacterium]|nr:rod shape-determining protein MreC [Chloroflexota bacterium]
MRFQRPLRWVVILLIAAVGILALDSRGSLDRFGAWIRAPLVPLAWGASVLTDQIDSGAANLAAIGNLITENRKLRAENARLQAENLRLQALGSEDAHLRQLLGFKQLYPKHTYYPARIITRSGNNIDPMITLDAGSIVGIKPGMAVVDGDALIGRVTQVSRDAAVVLPITNPSSAVAAKVVGQSATTTGIVQEEEGEGLLLRFAQATAPLRIGDWVVTSGMGGTFPPDLPIGRITAIQQGQVDVFQQAMLRPASSLEADTIVLVITDFVPLQLPAQPQ